MSPCQESTRGRGGRPGSAAHRVSRISTKYRGSTPGRAPRARRCCTTRVARSSCATTAVRRPPEASCAWVSCGSTAVRSPCRSAPSSTTACGSSRSATTTSTRVRPRGSCCCATRSRTPRRGSRALPVPRAHRTLDPRLDPRRAAHGGSACVSPDASGSRRPRRGRRAAGRAPARAAAGGAGGRRRRACAPPGVRRRRLTAGSLRRAGRPRPTARSAPAPPRSARPRCGTSRTRPGRVAGRRTPSTPRRPPRTGRPRRSPPPAPRCRTPPR
jgi:hypothetical protein